MNPVEARVRPRHQVLVLKCYPKYQKGVAEVKPNPSELSYLLYYASTRRNKVEKVSAYLEKKTTNDVIRGRVGNVQVTLHIIRGLIDKSPRDIPLYGPYVLRILLDILKSKNLPMVEESIPAFEVFCEHYDAALLTADHEISRYFEELVRGYADLAVRVPTISRMQPSKSVAFKWRNAGLQAIKCVTGSEAIGMSPLYLGLVMPVILKTLHGESNDWLLLLQGKSQDGKESLKKRRMSTATVQTADSVPEEPVVSTTTADADRQAEEETGLLAFESLEQIYSSSNRPQIRWATSALLEFVIQNPIHQRPGTARPNTAKTSSTHRSARANHGTLTLVEMVAKWAPVQDRFVIMVTASEALARSPTVEENMEKQLVLANVIEWLLGSTVNMIGLSVMDVLLTLVQHILLVLQLGGKGTNILPHHQPTEAINIFEKVDNIGVQEAEPADVQDNTSIQDQTAPSAVRQQLLTQLRKCIGNLATHIYYSDQVRDIISAILLRLKPPLNSGLAGATAAIERPEGAAQAIAHSVKMNEDTETDHFFSFGTARVAALNAIRDVLVVANHKSVVTDAGAIGRSRVSVNVWEGTQWLLRDEDKRVRRAYVEALLTWLKLEVTKNDTRIVEDTPKLKKKNDQPDADKNGMVVSKNVSNSSPNNKPTRIMRSAFLQLLHLAIYDNTLEAPEDDSNVLLMHLLLFSLSKKLGVNAVIMGLPMISRLQEDINILPEIGTVKSKVNVGSLVHGYLWALSEVFDFDTKRVGSEIQSEIGRRQVAGLWLESIRVPPQPLEWIITTGTRSSATTPPGIDGNESLRPFDHMQDLVFEIETSYSQSLTSPPGSPPLSPGRVLTMPFASFSAKQTAAQELPAGFKETMLSSWTKEACIAAAEKAAARTVSPHGSRSGTTRSTRNGRLATGNHSPRDTSPAPLHPGLKPRGRIPSPFMNVQPGQVKHGEGNASSPQTPISDSSNHTSTIRVDDLKRLLAGGAMADALSSQPRTSVRTSSPLRNSQTATQDFAPEADSLGRTITRPSVVSVGTDSMVDAEGFESASEGDIDRPLPSPQIPPDQAEIAHQHAVQLGRRPYDSNSNRHSLGSQKSKHSDNQLPQTPTSPSRKFGRPRSASETSTEDPEANARALRGAPPSDIARSTGIVADNGVPPVPPLPEGLIKKSNLVLVNGSNALSVQPVGAPSSTVLSYATAKERLPLRGVDSTSVENRPKSLGNTGSIEGGSIRSYQDSISRKSLRTSGVDKKSMVQALLGSIEVADVGGKGIGRPPY